MGWEGISDSLCPIARALSVVGDRWTLLILRELTMGNRRFDDLQAQTGMSSNLLAQRLRRLEEEGVIERRLYQDRPKRYEYHATEKGREFDAMILMLRNWGMKHGGFPPDAEPSAVLVHRPSNTVIDEDWRLPVDCQTFSFDDVDATIGSAWAAERRAKADAFRSPRVEAEALGIAEASIQEKG